MRVELMVEARMMIEISAGAGVICEVTVTNRFDVDFGPEKNA